MKSPGVQLIDIEQIAKIRRVAERLFTETCTNGDEARDVAQSLEFVLRVVSQLPVDDHERTKA